MWGVEIARLHAQVRHSALRISDFILQGSPIPEFAFTPQPESVLNAFSHTLRANRAGGR